jgi:cytochrome c oxidase cbb3-type subunit 3
MPRSICLFIVPLLAALGIGCQRTPEDVAAAAGPAPVVTIPVGPMPGPAHNSAGPTNPYGQNEVALTEGRRLFVHYNCYGCHGGRAGGGMGPSLRDPSWIYGSSDAQVFDSIAQGRAHGMPAWGSEIPQDQIWQLVAYVKSLGTPMEPDPPE